MERSPEMPRQLRQRPPEGATMHRTAIYGVADVEATIAQFQPIRYDEPAEVVPGFTATFHDAGHILGSAIIELRISDGGDETTVIFSGDLGRCDTPILRDPTPISHADFVLVESTYGNREHAAPKDALDELVKAIGEVSSDKGVLLVPSFAIGRT